VTRFLIIPVCCVLIDCQIKECGMDADVERLLRRQIVRGYKCGPPTTGGTQGLQSRDACQPGSQRCA